MARKKTISSRPRRGSSGKKGSRRKSNSKFLGRILTLLISGRGKLKVVLLRPFYIAIASVIIGLVGFVNFVSAGTKTAGPLEANYEGDTIFSDINIAPGFATSKTITITNNGAIDHSFAIALDNVKGDELANAIQLSPIYEGNTVWTKTITELSNLPEESMTIIGKLAPRQTGSVVIMAKFPESAGNEFKNKNVSFDITFGTQEPESFDEEFLFSSLGGARLRSGAESPVPGEGEGVAVNNGNPEVVLGAGEVEGVIREQSTGENRWLLLIVPLAAIASLSLVRSSKKRNIGIPLFFGAVAYLISNYTSGDMDQKIFYYLLGGEIVVAGGIKTVLKDHHREYIRLRRKSRK